MVPRARAALYHRVSTVDQNPELARRWLRTWARRLALRVALDVRETGKGTNNDRPGLQRVLQAGRRGEIDVVLVWKLDRFGRSAFDLLGNIRQLEAAGVRFVSVTEGIDIRPGRDPMSRLVLTLLSAIAEFERDLIVERTRLGLANARRAGVRLGRPPVPRPPAQTVKRLKAGGLTWAEVAEQLGCSMWAARLAAGAVRIGGSRSKRRARRGHGGGRAM
jgi:putative DNA-invertase from lambdoid prophage Rac